MSRIGRLPITIPEGVTVEVKNRLVKVVGSKGKLSWEHRPEIEVKVNQGSIEVSRKTENKLGRSLHGLTRTLINNMIMGVTKGWSKTLKLVGTGYRVKVEGEKLILSVGFSHPVEVLPRKGIVFEVKGNDTIIISGIDKALVGQLAADIRKIKPPEPYKGKGVRYEGEVVRRKPGKAAKVGEGFAGGGE
ncbi:50S ribosomal protein L6 [Patescibacteria group bacterium]